MVNTKFCVCLGNYIHTFFTYDSMAKTSKALKKPLLETVKEDARPTDRAADSAQRRLKYAVYLATFFMIAEVVGGLMANSLSIITDAAHMMSDVGGFIVSLFSLSMVSRKATMKFGFGFHQAEVLGAFVSILIVWVLTGMCLISCVGRFQNLEPIDGRMMCGLAVLGLVVNLLLMKTLGHNHSHDGPSDCSHGHVHGHKSHEHKLNRQPTLSPKSMKSAQKAAHGHEHGHGHAHGHEHGHGHEAKKTLFGDIESPKAHGHGHAHGATEKVHTLFADAKSPKAHKAHAHAHGHGHTHEEEEEESLAMKAAMAHVIGDIVQSLGVILASALIWAEPFDIGHTANGVSNWNYADPLCTVLFAFLVMRTTKNTVIDVFQSFMLCTPSKYDSRVAREELMKVPHVLDAHDIHIFEVGRNPVCTAHVTVAQSGARDVYSSTLKACRKVIADKFSIEHATIQVEIKGEFDHTTEKYGRLHDHAMCCNE